MTLDQARRELGVAAGERVMNRVGNEPVPGEPGRGAPVQRRRCRRVATGEAVAQQLREQRVVLVPAPLLVEPLHEEVPLGELLEDRVATAATRSPRRRDRRRAAAAPTSRAGTPAPGRQATQHLVHQVVGHVTVIAGEAGDEAVAVEGAAQ